MEYFASQDQRSYFEYLISGPKSFQDFRETEPRQEKKVISPFL